MRQKNLERELAALPPEAKQRVVDFIDFLKTRYVTNMKHEGQSNCSDEPFIGMWRDRENMQDSLILLNQLD